LPASFIAFDLDLVEPAPNDYLENSDLFDFWLETVALL